MAKGKRAKATELHWTEELAQLDGVCIHDNHRLHQHTPLRVGGPGSWVRCNTVSALRSAMPIVRKQSWRLHWYSLKTGLSKMVA